MTPLLLDPRNDLQRLSPYIPGWRAVCAAEGQDLAELCGIALRETLVGWAPGYYPRGNWVGWGDRGHGFGFFQIDDRSAGLLLQGVIPGAPDVLTPEGQALAACRRLGRARLVLARAFRNAPTDLVQRAGIAAYNAGEGRVAGQLVAGGDLDAVTAEGPSGRPDYSADVLGRADRLRRLDPVTFHPAGG